MAQKFRRESLVWVHVDKEKNPSMAHFLTDFYGIVAYTYKQRYRGGRREEKIYSVFVLNDSLTKVVNQISWYEEHQLSASDKLSRKQIENILKDLEWIAL